MRDYSDMTDAEINALAAERLLGLTLNKSRVCYMKGKTYKRVPEFCKDAQQRAWTITASNTHPHPPKEGE